MFQTAYNPTHALIFASSLVVILPILYWIFIAVYNVHFHPLSSFPGPRLASVSRFPYIRAQLTGHLPQWMKALHDNHRSDVVRVAPDALSFIGPSAWKDMYAHHQGRKVFEKDFIMYGRAENEAASVLTAEDTDHSRMRRLLAHAFSEKALKSQQSLLLGHVEALVEGLQKEIDGPASGEIDMVRWLKWITFDIIGDLSLGAKFDSLKDPSYHSWALNIQYHVKSFTLLSAIRRFPVLARISQYLMPNSVKELRASHLRGISDLVDRRLNLETTRPDFMTYIQRYNDEKGMNLAEIKANISLFIGAGSETVATVLCGALYYLGRDTRILNKVQDEVRSAFEAQDQITLDSTLELPYLLAVLAESSRMYPGALAGQPHIVPSSGASVCGSWIPGGTKVQMSQWAVYQSSDNFHEAHHFIPERWLGDPRFSADQREAFQPFSVGPRNCIGKNLAQAELRLILASFLWNFDFELSSKTQGNWPDQEVYLRWQKKPLIVKLARKVDRH